MLHWQLFLALYCLFCVGMQIASDGCSVQQDVGMANLQVSCMATINLRFHLLWNSISLGTQDRDWQQSHTFG